MRLSRRTISPVDRPSLDSRRLFHVARHQHQPYGLHSTPTRASVVETKAGTGVNHVRHGDYTEGANRLLDGKSSPHIKTPTRAPRMRMRRCSAASVTGISR